MSVSLEELARQTKYKRPDLVAEIDQLMKQVEEIGRSRLIDKSIAKFLKKISNSTSPDDQQELEKINNLLKNLPEKLNTDFIRQLASPRIVALLVFILCMIMVMMHLSM